MFPFVRLAKELIKFNNAPDMDMGDVHVSHHICWPWDLDMFFELNNGRSLSLYDLGRLPMARRSGFLKLIRQQGWGMSMAGATVRWRHRVTLFQRFEMRSGALGRDARFLYLHQTMWRKGRALSSVIYRVAVTDKNGIVDTQRVADAMGIPEWDPQMPEWVMLWAKSEDSRPWPPVFDTPEASQN